MNLKFEYIIVQCGGSGTRLMPYTKNKPKALVTVNNRPIIFHLFEKYPEKKYIIISDHQGDTLNDYLDTFAEVGYSSIKADGKGNVAGIKKALSLLPEKKSFLLVWSDLVLGEKFSTESLADGNYIGITDRFRCRWSYTDGRLERVASDTRGVAGCFLFRDKSALDGLPTEKSITKWLAETKLPLSEMPMLDSYEVGTVEDYRKHNADLPRCRPYNKITMIGDIVIKEGLTREAEKLLDFEKEWYEAVSSYHFVATPKIYATTPLVMERIHGNNLCLTPVPDEKKPGVIKNLVRHLSTIHDFSRCPPNFFDLYKDYYQKTLKRIRQVAPVIPFSDSPTITINGKACKNILFHQPLFRQMIERVEVKDFGIIHGDPTFSNTIIDGAGGIYFIDARGYFGDTRLYGDTDYDWAKLYYSIAGAFDQFNLKRFSLTIGEASVDFSIEKSGWEHLADYFFSLIPEVNREKILFIHSIIWLSLASHSWEDYDSMCLAFYNGTYLLNDIMKGTDEDATLAPAEDVDI